MSIAVEETTDTEARPVPGPGLRAGRRSQAPATTIDSADEPEAITGDEASEVTEAEAPVETEESEAEAPVEDAVTGPVIESEAGTETEPAAPVVADVAGAPAQSLEDLVRGQAEAKTARAIAAAAALDLSLSPKAAELLASVLVLSATDLSRGNPWEAHKMTVRDWFEGFLFEDTAGWLAQIGEPYSMRGFRTAMSSNDALAAFNSLPALVTYPGVRDEATGAVQHYLGSHDLTQQLFAAAGV
jgi:hypothetical protein